MKNYWIGLVTGALFVTAAWIWMAGMDRRSHDEMVRDYVAYRACIPKPFCMKADDYIDYYNLKWRLESE
jgi:hypothetical protein